MSGRGWARKNFEAGRANNFSSTYKAQAGPATFGICACEAQYGPDWPELGQYFNVCRGAL